MATTETRPSFRLPWSAAPSEPEAPSESPDEPTERPAEASIESGDMHDDEENQAPDMIETAAPAPTPADSEQPGTPPARRATKFMAELSHAMQAAAEHARNETMERFGAEAKAVVEEIHANATTEVADLRRKADDDVAAIRERSKAEIARIREGTETRVAARKAGLESEMEAHAATVEARAERVAAVVAAFETEMGAFFERLNAEEDPTRIATMAETMPDPPSLDAVVASVVTASTPAAPAHAAWPDGFPESVPLPDQVADSGSEPGPEAAPAAEAAATAEIDFAAAEAEALSFDGDLNALGDEDEATSESPSESPQAAESAPAESMTSYDAAPEAQATTRITVAGLISVASIANFKRSLARIAGVWTIGVSSGPNGDFVFTVSHDGSLSLSSEIAAMSAFETQLIGESDGEIQVSARDRDAAD
jgi:hypothetical protein